MSVNKSCHGPVGCDASLEIRPLSFDGLGDGLEVGWK